MVSNTDNFFGMIYLLVPLYCGKQIQPPRQGIEPRSHEWQARILTTILPRKTQIWKEFSFIYNKKCLQTLLNNGDYRQVSIFFQTTFINVTHHTLSISKLRKAKNTSRVVQRKRAGPITKRSVDGNHSLLCMNNLVFEINNFKWKVIMLSLIHIWRCRRRLRCRSRWSPYH